MRLAVSPVSIQSFTGSKLICFGLVRTRIPARLPLIVLKAIMHEAGD